MSEIATEITQILNHKKEKFVELYQSGNNWQNDWTKLLKTLITELGHSKEYFVNTGGLSEIADDGEWLFDLVWSKLNYNGEKTTIIDIPLVLESEISVKGFGGFKRDFDKLFFATNSTKIFVTKNNNDEILKECIDYATDSVKKNISIQKGDGVSLIIWQENKGLDFELINITK